MRHHRSRLASVMLIMVLALTACLPTIVAGADNFKLEVIEPTVVNATLVLPWEFQEAVLYYGGALAATNSPDGFTCTDFNQGVMCTQVDATQVHPPGSYVFTLVPTTDPRDVSASSWVTRSSDSSEHIATGKFIN